MIYKKFPFIEPIHIFRLLAKNYGTIFLDSSMTNEHYGRYSFIVSNPLLTYRASSKNSPPILQQLKIWQAIFANNQIDDFNPELPSFIGGLVGFFSYDLSKELEDIPSQLTKEIPDYVLGLYNQVFAFDHLTQSCFLIVTDIVGIKEDVGTIDVLQQLVDLEVIYHKAWMSKTMETKLPEVNLPPIHLQSNFTKDEYIDIVQSAKKYIYGGDIFEVNLAQCFRGKVPKNYQLEELYLRLSQINKAPFAAFVNFEDIKILSSSPERFLAVRGRAIEARPIKGTIRRGHDIAEDQFLAQQLKDSAKDRAENIMIVDLMRNDLAKICQPQSVEVSDLCAIESYTNVHHLVSVIKGVLKDETTIFDLMPACFPGGSITGAPKIRAMQIIEELEQHPRGVYCGSIGYFSFNGNIDLSITIRSIVVHDENISFHVGGAITLASDPESEYLETLIKGQKLSEALASGISNDFGN